MLSSMKSLFAGKTFLQTLFFFLLVTQICFAQWYQQNSGTTANLNSVHFEDANNGWAVGDSGTIIHTSNGGTTWQKQVSGTTLNLRDIFFIDSKDGWAVGYSNNYWIPSDEGIVLHTSNSGIDWTIKWTPQILRPQSVFFIDSLKGWIVGDSLTSSSTRSSIWYSDNGGSTWIRQFEGELGTQMNSVHFIDSINGWAGGNTQSSNVQSPLLKTTNGGVDWNYETNIPQWVNSIHFTDINNGWIVGASYAYQTTNGGMNWVINGSFPNCCGVLISVCFTDLNNGWILGFNKGMGGPYGRISHTTDGGSSWSTIYFDQERTAFYSCYFVNSLLGWVVGTNGIILKTTNGGNPVPVELNLFTATANGKEVTLSWSTATELNNQGFEVQRKFGSNDFLTVGSVKGHGTTTSPNNYTYVDKLTDAGKYFYRLKQIDFGGKYEYSQTVEVDWSPFTTYMLGQNFPNPFNPTTTIGFGIPASPNPSEGGALVTLKVYDILGNEVRTLINKEMEAGYHSINFEGSELPTGVYFYQLKAGSFIETKKMILVR